MKTYSGKRSGVGGKEVIVHDTEAGAPRRLKPRNDLWNHSPDGFEWGYGGSGPAQLALAILADALGDDQRAIDLHQAFKWKFVSTWCDGWLITEQEIRAWLAAIDGPKRCPKCGSDHASTSFVIQSLADPDPKECDGEFHKTAE